MTHLNNLLLIPGAKVAFGGKFLENHSIPKIYGSWHPTAVEVPLDEFLKPGNFELCNTEIFGAFQVNIHIAIMQPCMSNGQGLQYSMDDYYPYFNSVVAVLS